MAEFLNKHIISTLIPKRNENSHKYSFGKVLNIAGSKKYTGAGVLSSVSALKTGAGYVTLASVEDVVNIAKSYSPELTYYILNANENGAFSENNIIENLNSYNVISIGCGITTDNSVQAFVYSVLKNVSSIQKLVIDADAINCLSTKDGDFSLKNSIITPHEKELSRLLKVDVKEISENREKYARIASEKYECITVLKGKGTIITDGDKVYINTTGSSALSKSGTGDVLTGIIAGFLAQGASLFDASKMGVFMHGLSGDIASDNMTKYCVLASDIIDYLPDAFYQVLEGE